jgi:hypothetical protein
MKLLLSILITFCIFSANGQTVTLKFLKSLVFADSINQIDSTLIFYEYSYSKFSPAKLNHTSFDIVLFEHDDYENKTKEVIGILRDTTIIRSLVFGVKYLSYSDKLFNLLKRECENIKNIKLINETTDKNCFRRTFNDDSYKYVFDICETKNGEGKAYSLVIMWGL